MSDRGLLELAAKAAGYWSHEYGCVDKLPRPMWDPLADDGDALRLAVKLRLVISPTAATVMAYEPTTMKRGEVYEIVEADPQAATRRAIVRAAAEIEALKAKRQD